MRGRREVSVPCTSSWMWTPWSWAKVPHSRSDLPICSSVFSSGTSFGRPFGRTFTLGDPRSVRELHPFLGLVDVLAHDRLVCGVILAGRPEAADLHRRVLETLADIRPRLRRQRNLDAVLVRRPELHGVHPDLCEVLDDRRNVPVLRNLVGDGAELQTGPCRWRSGRLRGLNRGKGRKGANGEKVSSLHGESLTQVGPLDPWGQTWV